MRRQVLLLAAAQALFQTAGVMVMTIGGLAGGLIAPAPYLATAPIAAMFLGQAVATIPASMWMARVGRRPGFLFGTLLGGSGGLSAAMGMAQDSLLLVCTGTFLVGTYFGFAQFYRFAAAEISDMAFRPRAIAMVMAGGVVAALLGPVLARVGGPLLDPEYLGSFLLLGVVSLVATGLIASLRLPAAVADTNSTGGRSLSAIMRQPTYIVALFGAATGTGVMSLAMTATPIAMLQHQHGLDAAAMVIQLHVLGMYLPSFFSGALIGRWGVVPVMFAGVLLLAGHIVITLTGTGLTSFASALILLGIGWNFLFVGGTTLLTSTYEPAERGRAQAANDLCVVLVGLFSSLSSGFLLQALGWQMLNVVLLPWLAVAGLALLWLHLGRRRAQVVATL